MDDHDAAAGEPREPYSMRTCPDDGADMRLNEVHGPERFWNCPTCGLRWD